MAISLTILPGSRVLDTKPGTTILKAAHAGGVDINAICGGRGRCTSCRVKLVAGTAPPPTIMDELQLGDALVREGYRLSCQWPVTEAVTVQIAPPLDDTTFQILGGERPAGAPPPIAYGARVRQRRSRSTRGSASARSR
jgi:adenylate cyclase